MLNVVLIDDEKIVLKGIAAAIEKESGFCLVGTADNGIAGLDLITRLKPDIVLTDIRMPGITGLEMIRRVKKELPNTAYVVFSGFNEFKYVKEAIGLDVIDYIEKPVTIPKLREVLKKAGKMYQYQENYTELTKNLEKAERVCIEKALRDLYEQPMEEESYLKQILLHNPRLKHAKSICAIKIKEEQTQNVDDYRNVIQNLTLNLTKNEPVEVYSFFEKENLMLIYFNLGSMEFPFLEKATIQKEKIEEEVKIMAGISRVHKDFYELKHIFEEADSALYYARYLEASDIVNIDEVEYANSIPREISQHHKSLEFDFRVGQYNDCKKQIKEYVMYIRKMDLLPELFTQKCWELIFLLQQMLNESGNNEEMNIDIKYAEISNMVSGEKIAEWTLEKADQILKYAEKSRDNGSSRATRIVKQYIANHYSEGISLDDLAEQVHMSNTYLSMLFKKEEGITYIRYLTKIRMEKAMEFIKQGYKAKEVCEKVGYHDYKHFSTQFKSFTGMTLDNYKKAH